MKAIAFTVLSIVVASLLFLVISGKRLQFVDQEQAVKVMKVDRPDSTVVPKNTEQVNILPEKEIRPTNSVISIYSDPASFIISWFDGETDIKAKRVSNEEEYTPYSSEDKTKVVSEAYQEFYEKLGGKGECKGILSIKNLLGRNGWKVVDQKSDRKDGIYWSNHTVINLQRD